jgi:hypothetical protein
MKTTYTGRQAILTRWHAPTNTVGARMSARCDAGRIYVGYDHRFNVGSNHAAAAATLATKLDWSADRLAGGSLPNGDYAWVFIEGEA